MYCIDQKISFDFIIQNKIHILFWRANEVCTAALKSIFLVSHKINLLKKGVIFILGSRGDKRLHKKFNYGA